MTRWIVGAAVVGVAAVGVGRSPEPVCEHCGCASPPSTRSGVVNIDADYHGDTVFGTGIVLTPTGTVLTNDHVIRDTTAVCVTTNDRSYPATVVGMDPAQDLAVLWVAEPAGLATAPLGDSGAVELGDRVRVLGNDDDPNPDTGRVTALDRDVVVTDERRGEAVVLNDLIEISNPVPPGNSGGPLLDEDGRVIGVSTASSTRRGLAIPLNKALTFVRNLTRS